MRQTPEWLKILSEFANEVAVRRSDERHFQAEERHRKWARCSGRWSFTLSVLTTAAAGTVEKSGENRGLYPVTEQEAALIRRSQQLVL